MNTAGRLKQVYDAALRIILKEPARILFVSDAHMNDGGPADDFKKNSLKVKMLFDWAWEMGYLVIILGDWEDLWECKDRGKIRDTYQGIFARMEKFVRAHRLIRLKGNHDGELDLPEGLVIQIGDKEIFCAHGNQGDLFNDQMSGIGRKFVELLWKPLQMIGFHDLTEAKKKRHEVQEKRLKEWADQQKAMMFCVFGHTHRGANHLKYKNSDSFVGGGGQTLTYDSGQFRMEEWK